MRKPTFLFLLLFCCAGLFAQDDLPADGPYLFYEDDGVVARWASPEQRTTGEVQWTDAGIAELPAFPTFRPDLIDPRRAFHRDDNIEFSGIDSIAVISDVHGQYEAARKLLLNAGVMDEQFNWTYGSGHLVVVGDIFDRGPQVNEVLWMIHNLMQEAPRHGGRVHFLLGNHETMVLGGDVRYINNRYLKTTALLTTPYRELYGPDTYLGRWLRSLPLTIRINDMVFVHGGFSKELLKEVADLQKINNTYHRYLIDKDVNVAVAESDRLKLLHGRQGPLWYRGYFLDRDFTEDDIRKILRKLRAERLIVGHTSFNAIQSYFNGRVLAVDSSIKFGSAGEILLIENGVMNRTTLFGEREDLVVAEDKR